MTIRRFLGALALTLAIGLMSPNAMAHPPAEHDEAEQTSEAASDTPSNAVESHDDAGSPPHEHGDAAPHDNSDSTPHGHDKAHELRVLGITPPRRAGVANRRHGPQLTVSRAAHATAHTMRAARNEDQSIQH